MDTKEIAGIVLLMVGKGYSDHEKIKDSDYMFNATSEEKEICDDLLDELLETGSKAFKEKYDLNS